MAGAAKNAALRELQARISAEQIANESEESRFAARRRGLRSFSLVEANDTRCQTRATGLHEASTALKAAHGRIAILEETSLGSSLLASVLHAASA